MAERPIRPRRAPLLALALLAGAALACQARDRTGTDAVTVAQRFLGTLDTRQWDSAAALVDSTDAQRFRDQWLMNIASIAEHERAILTAITASGSGGMASGSTFTSVDTALIARHRDWPVRSLPGTPPLGEVAKLPPRRFYARMYETPANCLDLPDVRSPRTIGAVVDRDSVAYVVYETKIRRFEGDTASRETAVLTLARRGGEWRVLPGDLAPHFDLMALLDTIPGDRERMARECGALTAP